MIFAIIFLLINNFILNYLEDNEFKATSMVFDQDLCDHDLQPAHECLPPQSLEKPSGLNEAA